MVATEPGAAESTVGHSGIVDSMPIQDKPLEHGVMRQYREQQLVMGLKGRGL